MIFQIKKAPLDTSGALTLKGLQHCSRELCGKPSTVVIYGKGFTADNCSLYTGSAFPQWKAGRENPYRSKATPDAASVFFIVVISAHPHSAALGRTVSMVTLVGQLSGWPVPFDAGILTPISVTTLCERENSGGDSLNLSKEAAVMVATPTHLHPQFVFLFAAVRRCDAQATVTPVRVAAASESAARHFLAGDYVLSFAGRLPVQEVRHG